MEIEVRKNKFSIIIDQQNLHATYSGRSLHEVPSFVSFVSWFVLIQV